MASSKEDAILCHMAALGAAQLGAMSLGESAEKKDDDTEPTKLCSACGKESDTLKKCTACKCVWYCDVACQKRHRNEHRKECNRVKKEVNTAAEQLNESAERKGEPGNNEDANKNVTPTKKLCSACGEKSDTLKKCNGCLCVWYCDKDCQNKHRKEHRKECKRIKKVLDKRDRLFGKRGGKLDIGTEKELGPIGKLPPQEECPICMRVLPLHIMLHTYSECCGKTLCKGCDMRHQWESQKRITTERGRQTTPVPPTTCAFCRDPMPESDEASLVLLRKRAEQKDPEALRNIAMGYGEGHYGLPLDQTKCIDFMRQSADLGFPPAQYQLGTFHEIGTMGLEQNGEEALKYYKKAADGGHVFSLNNVGDAHFRNGDFVAAMRNKRLSASGGFKLSIGTLIDCFEAGILRHGDLAATLHAFYLASAEMKSDDRDKHIQYLKLTGKYEAGLYY